MSKIHTSLKSTEKRLVILFVGGAFLFLIIFEGFFLSLRFIFENRFAKSNFEGETQRMEKRESPVRGKKKPPMFPIIHTLVIDKEGAILSGEIRPMNLGTELEEMIDKNLMKDLSLDVITLHDDFYFKKTSYKNNEIYKVYVSKSGYPLADLLRDILRFLLMDIIIIIPFYFMGRYFVRETLEPVGKNIDMMGHFVHNAGHELKTPLAIISGNLQIMKNENALDNELLGKSISQIHAMSTSLDALLELTEGEVEGKKSKIKVKLIIEKEIALQKDALEDKGIKLTLSGNADIIYTIKEKHFSLLFSNLLSNAIKYNKEHGTIEIHFDEKTLEIIDSGIGMEEEDLPKIWERFYRIDTSREQSGNGIGLSLVAHIIELYSWKIQVTSKKDFGTKFTITPNK